MKGDIAMRQTKEEGEMRNFSSTWQSTNSLQWKVARESESALLFSRFIHPHTVACLFLPSYSIIYLGVIHFFVRFIGFIIFATYLITPISFMLHIACARLPLKSEMQEKTNYESFLSR
jgi:ABC-type protease/lipase transport system fused ATPase/permease subunit